MVSLMFRFHSLNGTIIAALTNLLILGGAAPWHVRLLSSLRGGPRIPVVGMRFSINSVEDSHENRSHIP